MMQSKVKRMLCALTMGLCLVGTAVPVCAQTVDFDITVPGDIISKKATKADSEQRFYVTGTYFNKSGYLSCISYKYNHKAIKSNKVSISTGSRSNSGAYQSYAAPGLYYYMETTASVGGLHVRGRYTP